MLKLKNARVFRYGAGPLLLTLGIASVALAAVKLGFHGGDNRLYTGDGDWAPQQNKGECGSNNPYMVGVASPASHSYTDAILCGTAVVNSVNYVAGVTLTGLRFGSSRRDTSTGDWAPGYIKAECGKFEVLTGLAQTTNPNAAMDRARCSPVLGLNTGAWNCYTRNFGSSDDPAGGNPYGDWEPGYLKGTCSSGTAIKGVAMNNNGGGANSVYRILCCSYQ